MLIVWGDRDRIIPVAHAYEANRAIPHSRLEIIPGAGHFPQAETPTALAEAVRSFVRETKPRVHQPEEGRRLLRRGPEHEETSPTEPERRAAGS